MILLPVLRFAYSFTVSVKSNRDPKAAVRFWWQGQKESNPQPMVLETTTLPVELYPYKNQRLPILPGGLPPSTFGVCGLNCCVRHGNRWIPAAIATEFMFQDSYPDNCIKMFA